MEPEEEPSVAAAREVCEEVNCFLIFILMNLCLIYTCVDCRGKLLLTFCIQNVDAFLDLVHSQEYSSENGFPLAAWHIICIVFHFY